MRREIERKLRSGDLFCVVATNALELGINIGSLDLSIHCGMPYSGKAGLVQQYGRIGRRKQDCASILLLDPSVPADAPYLDGLERVQQVCQLPWTREIVELHLQCAATELHINPLEEDSLFGINKRPMEEAAAIYQSLQYDKLHGVYCTHPRFENDPSASFGIRDSGKNNDDADAAYLVVDSGSLEIIDEVHDLTDPRIMFSD